MIKCCPFFQFSAHSKGTPAGICVCYNIRIPRDKVFSGAARKGKGAASDSYHLAEIVAAKLTPGSTIT